MLRVVSKGTQLNAPFFFVPIFSPFFFLLPFKLCFRVRAFRDAAGFCFQLLPFYGSVSRQVRSPFPNPLNISLSPTPLFTGHSLASVLAN